MIFNYLLVALARMNGSYAARFNLYAAVVATCTTRTKPKPDLDNKTQ